VSQLERRLLEAHRLGFKRAVISAGVELRASELSGMTVRPVDTIADAIGACFD
jgi:predicted ATP-dependent serine protease